MMKSFLKGKLLVIEICQNPLNSVVFGRFAAISICVFIVDSLFDPLLHIEVEVYVD